jgi:hypothetical protein
MKNPMVPTPPNRKPSIPRRWLLLFFVMLLISAMAAYPSIEAAPIPQAQTTVTIEGSSSNPATITPAASPTVLPTRVVSPASTQTNGLILGGVVLVLIIIGGTLSAIRQKPNH